MDKTKIAAKTVGILSHHSSHQNTTTTTNPTDTLYSLRIRLSNSGLRLLALFLG